jgi:hypothetical protein
MRIWKTAPVNYYGVLIYGGTYNLISKYGKSGLGVVMPAVIRG